MRYIRDVLADMPIFRDRARPLAINPMAKCSTATFAAMATLPPEPNTTTALAGFVAWPPLGAIAIYTDEGVPDGCIDLDGERLVLTEMVAFVEAALGASGN